MAHVQVEVDYGQVSRLLGDALPDRTFDVVGRPVGIVGTDVFGASGGRVAIELDVDGAVRGRLYLVGTPVLDASSGDVTVPDLGFSVSSRNVLLESAAWLLRGTFPGRVRRFVRWNVDGATEPLVALADRILDRQVTETVRMEGTVSSIRMLGIAADEDGFVVQSRGEGSLGFQIGPVSPLESAGERAPRGL